jgi:hypothetical protein
MTSKFGGAFVVSGLYTSTVCKTNLVRLKTFSEFYIQHLIML